MMQDADPTDGFVEYVDEATAEAAGLISTANDQVYIGVDYTDVASSSGRESVRITSTASYNLGLFILDLEHMPASICGTWPALYVILLLGLWSSWLHGRCLLSAMRIY